MKNDVYEPMMDPKRSLSFSQFIRSKYEAICYPEWNEVCKKHNGGREYERIQYQDEEKHWQVRYDEVPEDVSPFERADNLIHARTLKYKQWLNVDEPSNLTYVGSRQEFLDNTLHVHVDDLIPHHDENTNYTQTSKELQNRYIGEPLRKRCVQLNDEESFEEHVIYTKFNPEFDKKQIFDPYEERKKMLALYSKEDLKFVLSQLDLNFEKSIGYDYRYVFEMLNAEENEE
jgi:hypothetical protein